MAVTFATKAISVFGDKRVCFGQMDASGVTSGAVESGLRYINCLIVTPTSYTTAATSTFKYLPNVNSGGSAADGYIYVKNTTAADQFNVLAIGD